MFVSVTFYESAIKKTITAKLFVIINISNPHLKSSRGLPKPVHTSAGSACMK